MSIAIRSCQTGVATNPKGLAGGLTVDMKATGRLLKVGTFAESCCKCAESDSRVKLNSSRGTINQNLILKNDQFFCFSIKHFFFFFQFWFFRDKFRKGKYLDNMQFFAFA